jgi:hypothetical protein
LSESTNTSVKPDELHSEQQAESIPVDVVRLEGGKRDAALPTRAGPTWFRRLSSVLFIIFCFELGLFLLIYPWTDAWTENYLSLMAPARLQNEWRMIWNNSYVRGGVSGMGLVNLWIAVAEVFRMFARRPDQSK